MSVPYSLAPGGSAEAIDSRLSREANAGLFWARWLPMWEGPPDNPRPVTDRDRSPDRTRLLEQFARSFNDRSTGPRNTPRDLLRMNRERLTRALNAWAQTRNWRCTSMKARVAWRLVIGLGNAHATDTDLAFDPLVGVPLLAGSAVKGLCRSAAEVMDRPESEIRRLFGPESEAADDRTEQGHAIFFDAYPRGWPTLALDLVNCHHPHYYGEQRIEGLRAPSETESPIPAKFLCIDRGTEFEFPIAAETASDLDRAQELLVSGLSILGIGGKTAVGYGVMEATDAGA